MTGLRLYLDEDALQHSLLVALRARHIDVVSALDAGMLGRSDEDHLGYAAANRRVLYTFNIGDFRRIHSEWIASARDHSGIVLAPQQRYSVGEQVRRLLHLLTRMSAEGMKNRIEYLSIWGR